MKQIIFAIVITLSCGDAGAAEYTVKEFLNGYKYGTEQLRLLIEGDLVQMGNAFVSANAVLELQHASPIYCAPPKIGLTGRQYISIINGYVGNKEILLNRSISNPSMLLLYALKKAYPCK